MPEIIQLVSDVTLNTGLKASKGNQLGPVHILIGEPRTLWEHAYILYCKPDPNILFCCEIRRVNAAPFTAFSHGKYIL